MTLRRETLFIPALLGPDRRILVLDYEISQETERYPPFVIMTSEKYLPIWISRPVTTVVSYKD